MKTRYVFLAAMLFLGLGVSGAMAQGVLVPVTGYQPVTSYYAPPSYASPSYAAPSYAPASYAAPSYASASYADPNYASPGCAAPTYAPPGYAVANYPAPAVAYRPVLPAYVQPAVAYQPLVVQAARLQPYVAYQRPYAVYSPVVSTGYNAPVYPAPVAAPAGPKVWVHPKVYVEGQPIRNLLKAITP
jgi:hypothetical protein